MASWSRPPDHAHGGREGRPALGPEFSGHGPLAQAARRQEKVTGAAKYAADIRRPGMLYARVVRPPVHGATPRMLDTSAAAAVSGVRVLKLEGLVAVLAPDPETAERGPQAGAGGVRRPPARVRRGDGVRPPGRGRAPRGGRPTRRATSRRGDGRRCAPWSSPSSTPTVGARGHGAATRHWPS